MKNKKLVIILSAVLLLALSLVLVFSLGNDKGGNGGNGGNGDGGNTELKGHKDPAVYTYSTYTSVSPSNWNELTYKDNNDTQIMSYIGSSFFSYDFKYDAQGEIVPGDYVMTYQAATALEDVSAQYVGEEWGIPEGATARAWKITLREDLKWDNGDPIVAEDFVYTMKEQLDPEFEAYRADSFYVGGTIIHNAQLYFYQGESGWFRATQVYTEYSTDLDSKLQFSIGNELADTSYLNSWATSAFGETSPVSLSDVVYALNYYGCGANEEVLASMEGKTLAEIKADPTMAAEWANLIGWWQTEPNEELHMFLAEYTYPEMSFDKVGIQVGATPYELVIILDKALPLLNEDGSLSYKAAYNFGSLPLVHKATYEANKHEPEHEDAEWTSTYNTSVETTRSWGPYKLTTFQTGKYYELQRNEYWYGYNLPENDANYQTDIIACETIEEWGTAWLKFLAGEIDGIGIDVSVADDYKGSDRAYFTPDDYIQSMQLQSDEAQIEARESEGVDKSILTNVKFRKALSLGINRQDFAAKTTTSSKAGFGIFNSMHYYDVDNGKAYRYTDAARQVLCDVYGVDASQFGSLEEAEASITGYDLELARQLLTEAYNETVAAGKMTETDVVELTFGTSTINDIVTRRHNYVKEAWKKLAEGTPLEGRLVFSDDYEAGSKWADDFRAGKYDICMGGWTGAAWDPGYFLLAYLSPDYMYSTAWDTSSQLLTFTMVGVAEDGGDITDTMSLMDWYDCLNGNSGCKYDFSSNALEESQRLQLIAALEREVLSVYYTVPVYYNFSASLISYKLDYVTYEYNTFMGYGGIKYATYNYTDAAWAAEVAAQGGEIDYK